MILSAAYVVLETGTCSFSGRCWSLLLWFAIAVRLWLRFADWSAVVKDLGPNQLIHYYG